MSKVYRVNGKVVDVLTHIRNEFQKGFRNSDYNLLRIEKLLEKEEKLWDRITGEFNYSDTPERWKVEDELDKLTAKRRKIEDLPFSYAWEDIRMRKNYGKHYGGFEFDFNFDDDEFLIQYGKERLI